MPSKKKKYNARFPAVSIKIKCIFWKGCFCKSIKNIHKLHDYDFNRGNVAINT